MVLRSVLFSWSLKKKKNVSPSAWRISSSTEDDTWCPGLCSYQFSSNTSTSLNLSAFVPPGCLKKTKKHPGSVRFCSMHSWPQQRQIWELCHLQNTFIASSPGGIAAFRKGLFCWSLQTCHGWCCGTCTAQVCVFFLCLFLQNQ